MLWFEGTNGGEVYLRADTSGSHGRAPVQMRSTDLKSLNLLLAIYRNVRKGGCTTVDTIIVTKFASGRAVLEEKYVDETCDLGGRVQTPTFEHYLEIADGK
jgi:hypothetical protein